MMRPITGIASHMCSELGPFSATKVGQNRIVSAFTATASVTRSRITLQREATPERHPNPAGQGILVVFQGAAFRTPTSVRVSCVHASRSPIVGGARRTTGGDGPGHRRAVILVGLVARAIVAAVGLGATAVTVWGIVKLLASVCWPVAVLPGRVCLVRRRPSRGWWRSTRR